MAIDLGNSPTPPNAAPTDAERAQIRSSIQTTNGSWIVGGNHYGNTGAYCLIAGGEHTSNHGNYSVIAGDAHAENHGDNCALFGYGHENNEGDYSLLVGQSIVSNKNSSAILLGGGGQSQSIKTIVKGSTVGATPANLTYYGNAESTETRIRIPENSAWMFTINIIGARQDNSLCNAFTRRGILTNYSGSTAISTVETVGSDIFSFGGIVTSVSVSADSPNGALIVTVTGVSGQTWNWTAEVNLVQVSLQ